MFSFIVSIYNTILFKPLFSVLIFIYNALPGNDFGIAIIVLTIIIRVVLYPISVKALHSQRALQKLQPKIEEIQKKYKDDKEKQARETMELYKKEKVNPFSGLLLAIVQLPILIALYQVFWKGVNSGDPGNINTQFLGLVNLANPNIVLAILAGIFQFWQTKMLMPKKDTNQKSSAVASIMQKQMVYFFPVITVIILFRLPSALGLYWVASSLFSIIQQYLLFKKKPIEP